MVTARFLKRSVPVDGIRSIFAQRSLGLCIGLLLGGVAAIGCAQNDDSEDSDSEDSQSVTGTDAVFGKSTYSSPIALSRDGRLVWVVNPGDDSVSVIRTDTNVVIAKLSVGDEPQSIALTPDNKLAFVANTAAGSVSVVRIRNAHPDAFDASVDDGVGNHGEILTGSEPWNIVASPDGRRVFVANSGQDTITVIDAKKRKIIGNVDLRRSLCNDPDHQRHFQPRGLAVTEDNRKLYVTRFLSFVRSNGRQGDDNGKEGAICRLDIDTKSKHIEDFKPAALIALASQITGFLADTNGDGMPDTDTRAFPNQLQSIVVRGDYAYLPNIAPSPSGPLRFDVDTQAFVNVFKGTTRDHETDVSSTKFLNLNLGARDPEPGKKKLFFANSWAIAFTTQSGKGSAYVVSAGSDLLVKVNVAADGTLSFTVDKDTTRYIDLNDPANPNTSGDNAGKNPQGIVISDDGKHAWVANFVSRNVSIIDLVHDEVLGTVRTTELPAPGSQAETVLVGAEMFFSSRGHFDRLPGMTISVDERLSQNGWQNCASCHFKGLSDGLVWVFNTGPRKPNQLNGSFNPHDRTDQRILNYSAIFDEIEDFELNIRTISGPGNLAMPVPCNGGPTTSNFDPNHGLLLSDTGDVNTPPCVIAAFIPPNAGRRQLTVTLPGAGHGPIPALTALREWVRFAVRTPRGPFTRQQIQGGVSPDVVAAGRALFKLQGCNTCHSGGKWTISTKDFVSPPPAGDIFTERTGMFSDQPVPNQFLARFLVDIGSFNLGVAGAVPPNPINGNIGAPEFATAQVIAGMFVPLPGALGFDYNNDGKGNGFNVSSLLGIHNVQPYYHNGACETLACVVSDVNHRTALGKLPDFLRSPVLQALVVKFVESIDADTEPFGGRSLP
jgi:YVTN family beta-propeller protein